jgi:hypothetical protein
MKFITLIYWTVLSMVFSLAGLILYSNDNNVWFLLPVLSLISNTFYWMHLEYKGALVRDDKLYVRVCRDGNMEVYKDEDGVFHIYNSVDLVWED